MATILTSFLNAGLLQIGDDDEKFQLLETASEDLAKKILAAPILAFRLTVAGLDSRVPVTDPVHIFVEGVVTEKWQTIRNKTGPAPVQIYRSVIWRSLEIAAKDNKELQYAITLIARNQPVGISEDGAKSAIVELISTFEGSIAKELTETWVNPVDMGLPKLSAKIKKAQISKEDLATLNADTVIGAIQTGSKAWSEDMQEAIKEIVHNWSISLERLAGRDAKAELLWIRASQYSPSARSGLSQLAPADLVYHTMLDVSRAVSAMAPPSVEYFLRELVASLNSEKISLVALLTSIEAKFASEPEAKAMIEDTTLASDGRYGWLERAARKGTSTTFQDQTGVSDDYKDTLGELAVRLYRELQIRKLLASAK